MRFSLSQIPLVRLLVPFAIGIIAEFYFPHHFLFYYTGIFSFLLIFIWYWQEKNQNAEYSLRWVNGFLVTIFLISSGYCITLLHTPSEKTDYISNIGLGGQDSMVVTLVSIPQEKQKTYKATGEIKGIMKNGHLTKTSGKALFYFQKDSLAEKLNYGDELVVISQLNEVSPPSNPDEFNYKQFLQNHGINYECYVSAHNYSLTGLRGSRFLMRYANNSRKKLSKLLKEKIGGNEAEVASAILLGYREDLSRNVAQSFVDSGVVHVICVAGLHVGIIFHLLSYIIVFPSRFKYGKVASVVIILILLWLYALFTGLATPVLRATIMFSFLTIGNSLRKYTNTFNTLAASAFLILLFDPFSLADSGFQLSYISVLGILVIYKPLLSFFNPSQFILRKIWELASVSIAAQVAVLPLSLFYFHQFPNYFIFTNILVVPLLAVIIFSGIFYFLVSGIPVISTCAGWLLQKLLLLMNSIVSGASHLPFSVSKGISISAYEPILLYTCIILIIVFFSSKKYYLLVSGLSIFIMILSIHAAKKFTTRNQQLFTIYDIHGKTAVSFISGRHCIMPFAKIDSNDFNLHIQYNQWKLGVNDNSNTVYLTDTTLLSGRLLLKNQFVQFNKERFAFIRKNSDLTNGAFKPNLHGIIISEGYTLDIAGLKSAFNFDIVIFDSSVPVYKLKRWEEECKKLNLNFYSVSSKGAYIEKLST